MMTKWQGRYYCARKYKKSWEAQYVWLRESTDGEGNGYTGKEAYFCCACAL